MLSTGNGNSYHQLLFAVMRRVFALHLSIATIALLLGTNIAQSSGQYQSTLPSWHTNESLTKMISSHELETFGYPSITPLNSSQMDAGFRGSASFDKTYPVVWKLLFEKINAKQEVIVHVYGGSMTDGKGCRGRGKANYDDLFRRCSWQRR